MEERRHQRGDRPGAGHQTGCQRCFPDYLTNVNGTLYFRANDGANGTELWKSDGTSAGPSWSATSARVLAVLSPIILTNVNGTLYFLADDGTNGSELWKSDGTSAGTAQVRDINPGDYSASARYLTNVNGTLYFTAHDGSSGSELWKSDGTSAGTVLVRDILPGRLRFLPEFFDERERDVVLPGYGW